MSSDAWRWFLEIVESLGIAAVIFGALEGFLPARRGVQPFWRRPGAGLDVAYAFLIALVALSVVGPLASAIGRLKWGDTEVWVTADGGEKHIGLARPPEHGTVAFRPGGPRYRPGPGFAGEDRFEFSAHGPAGGAIYTMAVRRAAGGRVVMSPVESRPDPPPAVIGAWRRIEAAVGGLPFWLQCVLALLFADGLNYWRHRLMHTRWLWRIHSVHHSSEPLDWLSDFRVHPLDMLVVYLVDVVALTVFFPPAVTAASFLVLRWYTLSTHANVRVGFGKLSRLLVSPDLHRWHHARDPRMANRNFAAMFACWDWLFGTFRLPTHPPERFGVADPAVPRHLWGQLWLPLRRRPRGAG